MEQKNIKTRFNYSLELHHEKLSINKINKICDLVVSFDSKLSFNAHVKNITNKALI